MLIGEKSEYLMKRLRAKAKLNEYHIPEKLHGKMDEDVKYLLILAIGTIGDFSNDIVDNYNGINCNYEEHKKNLRFSSRFFDSYLDAKIYDGEQTYYLLLGSAVYYLCGYNGSSKVLADRVPENIELNVSQIDFVLSQILKDKEEVEYVCDNNLLSKVVDSYNNFQSNGISFDYNSLIQLKEDIYHKGTDREILFCDVLVAVIYLKIHNSSYQLLPEYTNIKREVWVDILRKGTLIKELWQSQQQLGETGIFAGQSATIQMPTSSGKTKSVALIILSAFLSKRANNAVVVAPFRSLCREISEELQKAFSFNDKIHVNEVSDVMQMDLVDVLLNESETVEKQIFVVTPEKLLFILRQNILFIANIGVIIFDEGHLFDDVSRGITYELLIATIKFYMKDKMQKVLISAVIPNAEQVNEWITNGRGVVIKNNIIQTTEKVVGIADIKINKKEKEKYAYIYFINPQNPDEEEFFVPRVIGQVPLQLREKERKERCFPEINNNQYRNDMAIALSINLCINGGVAIFCGKKETANKILNRIIEIKERGFNISNLTNNSDWQEVERLSYLIECEMGKENVFYKAAKLGVYTHHGGIPMGIRSSVEYAMQVGKIRFIACTSTLAQGVNLPIRYLIISNVYQGKERIKVRDFQNLIGRAGRAGIYTEGTILLSETSVYNSRKNMYNNWRWNNYKSLLNNEQAEACTSALFAWIRADYGMEKNLENILNIFRENYADGCFNVKVKEYLKLQKFGSEENYSKTEFIVNQMIKNIESIESFLLFYLMEDSYDKSKETIHDIVKETLAYYLAEDYEKERLLRIIDIIGESLVKTVDTADKRNRYSKSLLGITKEIYIERWVYENLEQIEECRTEISLLNVIFPLLLESENANVSKYVNKELLSDIALDWIRGKTYFEIEQQCIEKGIRLLKRGIAKAMTLQDVIDFCDGFLGYDCTLILAAVIENIEYYCENDNVKKILKLLCKKMKYGLATQTSIILYEIGFNNRIIATEMANVLDEQYVVGSRKDILNLLKRDDSVRQNIDDILQKYPSYFYHKFREHIYK